MSVKTLVMLICQYKILAVSWHSFVSAFLKTTEAVRYWFFKMTLNDFKCFEIKLVHCWYKRPIFVEVTSIFSLFTELWSLYSHVVEEGCCLDVLLLSSCLEDWNSRSLSHIQVLFNSGLTKHKAETKVAFLVTTLEIKWYRTVLISFIYWLKVGVDTLNWNW